MGVEVLSQLELARKYFEKSGTISGISSLLPLTSYGGVSDVFIAKGGKHDGRVVKQLKFAWSNNPEAIKSLATHAESLRRLNIFPFLPFPKLYAVGKLDGKLTIIETFIPGVLGNTGANKLSSSQTTTEQKIAHLDDLFKSLNIAEKLGVIAVDIKLADTAVFDSSIPLVPRIGLIDLGSAFVRRFELNVQLNEQQAWREATLKMRQLAHEILPELYREPSALSSQSFSSFAAIQNFITQSKQTS